MPFALYVQQVGTKICHFEWYLPHFCMVTLHVALFCNAVETVPKLGADRDVGRNRHYAKIEAMGAMVAMAAMLCCFRMFQAFFVQSTYRLT